MKEFLYKYAHWIALGLCAALTLAVLKSPDDTASPAHAAAAHPVMQPHFTGETLALQPYLPDEPTRNETLGLWQTHAALDLACEGNVYAPIGGRIVSVSDDPVWGVCIEILNDAERLTVRSLSSAAVRAGDLIQKDDMIGIAGAAPCEAGLGAHIHAEYMRGGLPADPYELYK